MYSRGQYRLPKMTRKIDRLRSSLLGLGNGGQVTNVLAPGKRNQHKRNM